MTRPIGADLLCAGAALFLLALPAAVFSEQSATNAALPVRSGIISIRLESNKTVYRLGEPIELRVTLVNHTAQEYIIGMVPAWSLCRLSVRNEKGQALRPTLRNMYGVTGGDFTYVLPAHGTVSPTFSAPGAWADIKYWLYDLDKPGTYVIVGSPTEFSAYEVSGHHLGSRFVVSPAASSNTVHIKIVEEPLPSSVGRPPGRYASTLVIAASSTSEGESSIGTAITPPVIPNVPET
jgi:hypothetical protein